MCADSHFFGSFWWQFGFGTERDVCVCGGFVGAILCCLLSCRHLTTDRAFWTLPRRRGTSAQQLIVHSVGETEHRCFPRSVDAYCITSISELSLHADLTQITLGAPPPN